MATGGISEREERVRRRNREKELEELTSQTERMIRESEAALHERTFDDVYRTRTSDFGERTGERDMTVDSIRTLGIYPDRGAYSTPHIADRPRRESVSDSLNQTESDRRETERRYRREREADPYRLGVSESEPVKTHDDNFDLSIDDTFNEFKRRVHELSTSILTVDQANDDEEDSSVKEKERKEFDARQTLLLKQEKTLNEKEMKMVEREKMMTKREAYLKEMERTLLEKMDQLEKEHLKKERNLQEKEQEITSYMKETERKMNERIDKLEKGYQRKDKEMREKESAIEKMESEWREKLNHRPERERTDIKKQSVRIDTDTDTENDIDGDKDIDRRRRTDNRGLDNLNLKLNLTPFSGMEPVPRNEATFEEWKLEVECVKAIYSEMVVVQAIRKALKGQAKRIMLHLGPYASVEKIEKKLEDAFGNITSKDSILSHFFLAEQADNESIVEWGLRLEDMLLQASRKTTIAEKEKEDMLKRKFWRGLKSEELQNATRVHFERDISYEELRKQVRSEEFEIRVQKERKDKKEKSLPSKVTQSALSFQDEEGKQMMKLLIEKMEQLDKKVEEIKKENEQVKKNKDTPQRDKEGYRYNRGRGYNRGRFNRGIGRGQDTRHEHDPKKDDKKPDKTDTLNGKSSS